VSTVTLKSELHATSALQKHIMNGIDALDRRDQELIAPDERRRVGDSLYLDKAVEADHPQEHRWDYVLSVPDAAAIIGIEPHSAKDSEISVVIKKKCWAAGYLRKHMSSRGVSRWFWVTHGRVGISILDKERRRLSKYGIEFVGKSLRSLS